MKSITLKFILVLSFLFVISQSVEAQSSSSSSYSYSSSKNSSSGKNSRTSVSSSESNEYITVNARFNKHKTEGVLNLIIESLGKNNESKGRKMIWDDVLEGLELSLSKGRLRLFYEKDNDKEDEDLIRDLVEAISESIQG